MRTAPTNHRLSTGRNNMVPAGRGLSRGFCKTITFGKGQATHCCWSTQRSTICDLDHTKEKPEQQQRYAGNRTNKVQIMAGTVRGSPVHPWQQMKRLAYVDRNHHKQTAGASQLESRRPGSFLSMRER